MPRHLSLVRRNLSVLASVCRCDSDIRNILDKVFVGVNFHVCLNEGLLFCDKNRGRLNRFFGSVDFCKYPGMLAWVHEFSSLVADDGDYSKWSWFSGVCWKEGDYINLLKYMRVKSKVLAVDGRDLEFIKATRKLQKFLGKRLLPMGM